MGIIRPSRRDILKKLIKILILTSILVGTLSGCVTENDKKEFSKDDMIYFILTDRFYDGNTDNNYEVDKSDPKKRHGGDLSGIIEKLPYIKSLGATSIWITPVMKNEKDGYHGYWIEDFYQVDPHLGSMDDMKELVEKSHELDIKVILDYVVNHTGYNSPWLNDEKYKDWFNENKSISNWSDQDDLENGWLAGLPDLNFSNPEVRRYFIENALWWIEETGIDGMRLDTVKHVPRDFWKEFVNSINEQYPEFFFLGEVWSENVRYFKAYSETGITGMTNYPLYKGIITTFREYGNTNNLKTSIREDSNFSNPGMNGIFIDNHDNIRFPSIHKNNPVEYHKQALTFIMSYPAIPVIYYGNEIGMEGHDDPDNRRDMQWDKVDGNEVLEYFKFLSNLRSDEIIKKGTFKVLETDNFTFSYTLESENEFILFVINIFDRETDITLAYEGPNQILVDLIGNEEISVADNMIQLKLKPLDIKILKGKK